MHSRTTVPTASLVTFFVGLFFLASTANASRSNGSSAQPGTGFASPPVLSAPVPSTLSQAGAGTANSPSKLFLPLVAQNQPSRALWRFGVGDSVRPITDYSTWLPNMRFGWYINWSASASAPEPQGIEYVQVVNVKQWKLQGNSTWTTFCVGCAYVTPYTYTVSPSMSQIASIAASRPGKLWLLGNELENRDTAGGRQDEIVPELYAQAYHDLYTVIKQADPTALVANGSEIEPTPLRLKYLDIVWNTYQSLYGTPMPVDVWNMHLYIFAENCPTCFGAGIPAGLSDTLGMTYTVPDNKNFAIAEDLINGLRVWMKQHGQQRKPLILSEYGVSIPDWVMPGQFTPEQIRDSYMYPSFNYFLNHTDTSIGDPLDGYRLIQRWNIWSMDYDVASNVNGVLQQQFNGNLFYSGKYQNPLGISTLGSYYQQYVQGLPNASQVPTGLFAPQKQPLASFQAAPGISPPGWTFPAQCAPSQQVELRTYAPSAGPIAANKASASSPALAATTTICAVPAK